MKLQPESLELRAHDQLKLHVLHNRVSSPRGVVVLLHGLSEHARRHQQAASQLVASGFAVLSLDMRGHGASEGQRGGLVTDEDPLFDVASVFDLARELYPGSKRVLMGNSIGGAVAARFASAWVKPIEATEWMRPLDALILTSPALEASMSLLQKTLLTGVGSLMPDLAMPVVFKPEWMNSDPEVVREFNADPFSHKRVTPRLAKFVSTQGKLTMAKASSWHIPTLLLYSPRDRLISPQACERFAQLAPAGVVSSQTFPTMVHDILREPDRQQVFKAVCDWLGRLPALSEQHLG